MTSNYQMPLFCRYDLSVEFDWKRKVAEKALQDCLRKGESSTAAIDFALAVAEIYPIQLCQQVEGPEVTLDGHMEGTGEPVYCFTFKCGYSGDEQLWHMDPGIPCPPVDGEIFRYKLILAIGATTRVNAEECLATDRGKIERTIRLQSQKIREFEEGLPRYIEAHAKANGFFRDLLGNSK